MVVVGSSDWSGSVKAGGRKVHVVTTGWRLKVGGGVQLDCAGSANATATATATASRVQISRASSASDSKTIDHQHTDN